MNKIAIKNFAIWARNKLIADISYKAGLLGITDKEIKSALPQSTSDTQFFDIGTREPYQISGVAIAQRKHLADKINEKASQTDYATAYKSVIEEVAYTWFNRLIAIRFMEVNEYLPSGIRVLSSESGKAEPDIVSSPFETDLKFTAAEREYVISCKTYNKLDELFRMLFIKQCNALNAILPELFEETNDYSELLLNISFTDKGGVVWHLVSDITEDDFKEAVEIIGWLYQYYNTEPKDETFALLKKNVKITKERIPAATQLFTPHWIVRYMVENSLGRLWLESIETRHCGFDPQSPAGKLRANWKYYLDEAEQTPEVEAQLEQIRAERQGQSPEDITFLDPCMGSGHILIYAFEVFMQIYESAGYNQRDAAILILEKNLYGLEIDKRAYQLAYFALLMKARKYNRSIFKNSPPSEGFPKGGVVTPQVYHPAGWLDGEEYGSLIKIDSLGEKPEQFLKDGQSYNPTYKDDLHIWNYKRLLSQRYSVVCTNPPYMGSSGMNGRLSQFVKDNFPDSKSDLFAVFIEKCGTFTIQCSLTAMITQHAWMFLSSYEKLRIKLRQRDIMNMAHLGARAFAEIGGEVVQATTFVMRDKHITSFKGSYIRLVDINDAELKERKYLEAIENPDCGYRYTASADNFAKIPGSPVAYWVSEAMLSIFDNELLGDSIRFREGIHTADNARFLRFWWEPENTLFVRAANNYVELDNLGRWVPYNKGGTFRKWYGNNEYVIGFDRKLRAEMSQLKGRVWPSQDMYFKAGGTWTAVTSGKLGVRYYPNGFLFDAGGQVLQGDRVIDAIALLNTKLFQRLADIMMPTINYKCGILRLLPDLRQSEKRAGVIAGECISLSKSDWDSFETSWDFKQHQLTFFAQAEDEMQAFFCLKIGEKKWIESLRDGTICFSPVGDFIEQAILTGNDEQGDEYEGVFGRLRMGDSRIVDMHNKYGDDLDIIPDGDYVLLRRKSCKSVPVFCLYGIYKNDFKTIDDFGFDVNGIGHLKARVDLDPRMYNNFIQSGHDPMKNDSEIWGFYGSVGHLKSAIELKLNADGIPFTLYKVDYDKKSFEEFLIEPNEFYNELRYKDNKFNYQNEMRFVLHSTHQSDKKLIEYEPLYPSSANASKGALYFEADVSYEKKPSLLISDKFTSYRQECEERFNTLKSNEEELNRIFIDIYSLQDELTPEVEDKDVTVHRVFDTKGDIPENMRGSKYALTKSDMIRSLLSYAIGCMFGRYSLDVEGLAFAGGEWDAAKYSSFIPDSENIIPITDEEYLPNDIVTRIVEFVRTVYGEETLEENLRFVADAIETRGSTAREVIRNYFLKDFYKDHVKIYKKRPIYWLFDSGKENGFKALIYLHRYNQDIIGKLRIDYLHKLQRIYENEINRMRDTIEKSGDAREVSTATKRMEKLTKQLKEAKEYDEKIAHLALARIELDLDDGVKVNYEKLQTDAEGNRHQVLGKI